MRSNVHCAVPRALHYQTLNNYGKPSSDLIQSQSRHRYTSHVVNEGVNYNIIILMASDAISACERIMGVICGRATNLEPQPACTLSAEQCPLVTCQPGVCARGVSEVCSTHPIACLLQCKGTIVSCEDENIFMYSTGLVKPPRS